MYDICKKLSKEVYNNEVPKVIDGWEFCERKKIQDMDVVSKGEVISRLNLACVVYKKENEIILAFRGTNDLLDLIADTGFLARRIPPSMTKAYNIYKRIRKEAKDYKIIITGHSLGGAYAQVIAGRAIKNGDDNCYGITFNAPGMEFAFNKKEREEYRGKLISNISNYVIMNDFVGNFRTHLGATYYIQPYPLDKPSPEKPEECDTPHGCIITTKEPYMSEWVTCPKGWDTKKSWALFVFDETKVKGFMGKFKKLLDIKVNRKHLVQAIQIIEKLQLDKKLKLVNTFRFKCGKYELRLLPDAQKICWAY